MTYASAADHYARYRPRYPGTLLADLRTRTGLDGTQRLLDLACGTGEVALALAADCATVRAVDEEPAMLAAARAKDPDGAVDWVLGRAEDVPVGEVDLVTVGNAFHRLEGALVARQARDRLAPGGHLALLNTSSVWRGTEPWQRTAVEVIARWTGGPARGATAGRGASHADVVRAAGFASVAEYTYPTPHAWTLDAFVGYVYSTAVASPAVLGDRRAAFESELRVALLAHEPAGHLRETITFDLLLAPAG